jgi:hypothetical protein
MKTLVNNFAKSNKTLSIIDNKFAVKNNQAIFTDLESWVIVNNAGINDGIYNVMLNRVDNEKMQLDDFPKLPELKDTILVELDATEFVKNMYNLAKIASNDEMLPVMGAICFDLKNGCLVSTDAHRLKTVPICEPNENAGQYLIPKIPAGIDKLIKKFGTPKITVELCYKTTKISSPDWELYLRNIEGTYPNYQAVIPSNYDNHKWGFSFEPETIKHIDDDYKIIKKLVGSKDFVFQIGISKDKATATYENIDNNIIKTYPINVFENQLTGNVDEHNTAMLMPVNIYDKSEYDIAIRYNKFKGCFENDNFLVSDYNHCLLITSKTSENKPKTKVIEVVKTSPVKIEVKTDKKIVVKQEVKTEVKTTALQVNFIDYSERAVAIVGDTIKIKDILKELGCRYNKFLSCGAGWIASKRNIEAIKKELSKLTINVQIN